MSTESYLDLYRDAAFVRRMAGGVVGEAAIEDVWQEAWREVLEHPPKAGWDVRGYVWTVARRMAGRARRGDGRRVLRERAVARPEALPSDVELLERLEVHKSLVAELMQLEEPYRRTLLLGFFEGLAAAEIASREGVSLETVRTRRKRALGLMRERLRRKHGEQREWLAGLLALAGRSAEELAPAAPRTLVVAGALTAVALLLASLAWWRGAGRELERVPVLAGGPLRAPERELDSATVVPARVAQAPRAVDAAAELPPATPAEPWRLGGRVTDLAGRGLAGAEVTARLTGLFSVETLASTHCDADGRYELALAALTPVEVRARFLALEAFALGHRAETRELPLAELGARVEAEFVLGEGRTLEGLVLDERGAPVAKAIARVHGGAFGGEETELLAATDEHGRYRLGLAPEFTLARVEAWRADLGWGELAARALPQAL
ncbi:MAG: sigma-70 family RNA polymerase sigma factor, partial [Planctomycetota bacterium]